MSRELDPEERLLVAIVRLAIKDAQQDQNVRQRYEARKWLSSVAPRVMAHLGISDGKAGVITQMVREGIGASSHNAN